MLSAMRLSSVRVLIWDFDGTLYRAGPLFHQDILEAQYRIIMEHNCWGKEKAKAEFHKLYKIVTPSSTEAAAQLAGISVAQAAIEGERENYRLKYISRDERLIQLFASLTQYTHYILINGVYDKVIPALNVLGISEKIFAEIVTSEIIGESKPNPKGFLYIMQKTGLPAEAHLMIGDREAVDLAPAKALGMRTCLVWSKTKSEVADVTLPSVYDIVKVL